MSALSPKCRDWLPVLASNNSIWPGVVISIEVGLAVFLLIAITDMFALRGTFGHEPVLLADVLASLLCGGLAFQLWRHLKARQDRLLKRIEVIAEMNHHIRNALEDIQYSAYATQIRTWSPTSATRVIASTGRCAKCCRGLKPTISRRALQIQPPRSPANR